MLYNCLSFFPWKKTQGNFNFHGRNFKFILPFHLLRIKEGAIFQIYEVNLGNEMYFLVTFIAITKHMQENKFSFLFFSLSLYFLSFSFAIVTFFTFDGKKTNCTVLGELGTQQYSAASESLITQSRARISSWHLHDPSRPLQR